MADLGQASRLIAAGRLEELEDRWLEQTAAGPDNLGPFLEAAQLLAGSGERERAAFLLELLDEQLCQGERWALRLQLLEGAGPWFLEAAALHEAVMVCLRRMFAGGPSLEGLIEKLRLLHAIEDTPKLWTKVERLRELMQFEVGSVVWMKGKGAGRVVEVNLELESFKLDLQRHPALRVGFAAASKLLRPLPASHIERRKLEDPAALRELRQQDPGALLQAVLGSFDRPLAATEIRAALEGIVGAEEWTRWWSEGRKHPQLLSGRSRGRPTYSWAESEEDALDLVRQRFAGAELTEKLEIFRRNADRPSPLVDEMRDELRRIADRERPHRPELALAVWHCLQRSDQAAALDWSPASLLHESQDPVTLLVSSPDRSVRAQLYGLCAEERSDWPSVYQSLLTREGDPRLLNALAERLRAHRPEQLARVIDDVLTHPRRHPAAFVWLAELADSELLGNRNPLRLLRQILDALHQTEFSGLQSRLRKTLQPGGAAVHLLSRVSEEEAVKAGQALSRAPLEEHVREALLKFLQVRFPALDSRREVPLYATLDSIQNRREELRRLREEEIPANRRAIEEARALGDLRENFEYKAARQRHEYLNARLAALERELGRVRPLDSRQNDHSEVRIGCRLTLRGEAADVRRFLTILGPWESDPERGIVSYDSELGREILGKKLGDRIVLEGEAWELTAIGDAE